MFNSPPITNPVTLRARGVLVGAAVWDVTPLVVACSSKSRMTLYIEYTRGAVGGVLDFQIRVSPYSVDAVLPVQTWFEQSEFTPAVLAVGVDSQSRVQREYISFASREATETFVYGPVDLGANVERVQVRARESGGVAVGTCHIMGIIFSEQ
jgi:hypothetical protein